MLQRHGPLSRYLWRYRVSVYCIIEIHWKIEKINNEVLVLTDSDLIGQVEFVSYFSCLVTVLGILLECYTSWSTRFCSVCLSVQHRRLSTSGRISAVYMVIAIGCDINYSCPDPHIPWRSSPRCPVIPRSVRIALTNPIGIWCRTSILIICKEKRLIAMLTNDDYWEICSRFPIIRIRSPTQCRTCYARRVLAGNTCILCCMMCRFPWRCRPLSIVTCRIVGIVEGRAGGLSIYTITIGTSWREERVHAKKWIG